MLTFCAEHHRRYILRGCRTTPQYAEPCTQIIAEPLSNSSPTIQEEEASNETPTEDVVETAVTSQRPQVPKREKFDSGVDDLDNGKGDHSSDEDAGRNANYQITSDEEIMEIDSDCDLVEPEKSDDEGLEEDIYISPKKGPATCSKPEKEEPEFTYRSVMQDKIKSLPLPPLLKAYLNFYREF